ncbi:DUF308 domain-containing protein [Ruminococcus sp.]|uniref:DUF308 domain-containing protein n=1 Tax=Ruminococcus sp. TaxID=41978 RepID=UPI002E7A1061|nr:DUF308 domain-containing protein [Ruminococcus sp.]MEE1261822.1 hypothetical protein [Ruminococcus sp.]
MSKFQRVRSFLAGLGLILLALILLISPESGIIIVAAIISFSMLFYGFRTLWFYATMARHMVGGKSFLYQGIIVLDIALFTIGLIQMSKFLIMIYLMGVYAFSGAIDILRALEAKKNGSPSWNMKLISGCIRVAATIALFIIGIFFRESSVLIYGYCINLGYAAVMRFINAFRRTAIVYIQ